MQVRNFMNMRHRLVAYVLALGLFLQSCGNLTNPSATISSSKQSKNNFLNIARGIVVPQQPKDQEFVADEGYLVRVYKQDRALQACVEDNLHTGFCGSYTLPVYVGENMDIARLAKLSIREQQRLIQVHLPNPNQLGYVYIGNRGIWGGMMEGELSLEEIVDQAERGGREAQYQLAQRYFDGTGVPQNEQKALEWYRKSAMQGYPPAIAWVEKFNLNSTCPNDEGSLNLADEFRHIDNIQLIEKDNKNQTIGSSPYVLAKTRKGFTDKSWFTNKALNSKLPLGYKLGAAYDDGDCFFDALAQGLNQIENTDTYTVKSLRESCHKFYQQHKHLVADWDLGPDDK